MYAAGVLEKAGYNIKFIDSPARNHTVSNLIDDLRSYQPDFIVIYTSTGSIHSDVETSDELKKEFSNSKICLVGPHVSVLPEETFQLSNSIDFILRKEFDYSLRDFVKTIENGSDLSAVKGLSYRLASGEIKHNPDRELIKNLDELPFVSEVLKKHLDYRDYHMDYLLYPFIQIYTGRGCPYKCSFCLWPQTLMGRGYRQRSLENIFKEIDYIRKEFPTAKEIMIDDDSC